MANLGPLYQNQTYSNLLQIDGGLSADLKKVLDGDGNESGLSLSFTAASITGLVSESANNLYGGAAGTIPYQSSSNNTAFTTAGPVGYVLSSNGTLPPTWVNTIPFSSFAAQATNIGGGGLGQLPYQADLNSTSFVPAGTPGQVLVSGGLSAPFWSNSVPAAGTAGTANAVLGGVAGNLLYQSGVNTTSYVTNGLNGQYLRSQGALAPIWDTLTAGDVGAVAADGSIAMTGALNLGSNRILNVAPPAIGTDGANKDYVDAAATGLKIKTACRAATTANITLSGLQTVDGVALNNLDRVLVKEQGAPATNGIYLAVSGGPWTRTADADTWSELYGATVFITNGTVNANSTWAATIPSSGVLGVDEIRFALFGASASYTAGTGLNLIGSQFSLATPVTVSNGGIGVSTITGILKGNGTSAISTATAADIVGAIGATTVQNATTAATCTGNAGSATVLATARTINGVAFNGSANISIESGTPNTLSFSASGTGISPGGSWRGLTDVTVSYNSIGAAARDGSNVTSVTPWNIDIGGRAIGLASGIILPATQGGTGYGTSSPYTAGSLLYASTPTNIGQINPLATNNRVLLSGPTPAWGRVALATDMVDGVLPVIRGGTGNNVTYLGNAAIYTNPTGDTLISGNLPVASGGTGANNAAQARFNLGSTILGGNLFTIPNQAAITFPRFNADNTVSALSAPDFRAAIGVGTGTGTVTSVGLSAPIGLTVSGSPITGAGTLALTYTAGYSIPTTAKQAEWDAAFTQRLQWDGGATNLVAATGRASLGLGNIATINTTGSTTNFLRADGTWQAPTAASTGWTLSGTNTYTNNAILQGLTAPVANDVFQYISCQLAGKAGDVGGNLGLIQYSNDASCSFLTFGKSRSTIKGENFTRTIDGDDLGEIRFSGTTGSGFSSGGFTTSIVENMDTDAKICMTYNIWTRSRSFANYQINTANATDGHFIVNPSDFAPQRTVPPSTDPNQVIAFVNPNNGRFMLGTKQIPTFTMCAAIHPAYQNRSVPCQAATTANITLSGVQTIDGVALGVNGIVLVKNQITSSQNGIYRVQSGAWTRYNETNGTGNYTVWTGFYSGGRSARFHVYFGTTNKQQDFVFSGATTGTVGSTAITFANADRWDFGPDTNHDFLATYWDGSAFAGQKIQRTSPASGWVNYSDERVKTIVSDIENATAKVSGLRSVIGYMNNDSKQVNIPMLIAQDVQQVLPQAVFEDHDEDKTLLLSYQSVIPLLVAAIKELSAKVEALENANNG
jgi:hypothetical protein